MVIRRVAPLSCAKIAAILYAVLGLIAGGLFSLAVMSGGLARGDSEFGMMGPLFGIGAIIILPILYACLGFVGALLMTWVYNVAAGIVGGIEIHTE